jgi:hypothetical protein
MDKIMEFLRELFRPAPQPTPIPVPTKQGRR